MDARDPYRDIAPEYDLEHDALDADCLFYSNLLAGESVLEVGVGTGRIMAALVARGLDVWGVDPSSAMLNRARLRLQGAPNAHLIEASWLEVSLDRRFHAVIFPLNVLWHFNQPGQQLRALQIARQYLVRDGIVIVDCSNPLSLSDRGADGQVRERFRVGSDTGVTIGSSAAWDDEAAQILSLHLRYEHVDHSGRSFITTADLRLRYLFRAELELLLNLAALAARHVYGSYDLDPYEAISPRLIAIATKSPRRRADD